MAPFDRATAISSFIDWLDVPQSYTMHYRDLAHQLADDLQTKYFPKVREVTDQQVKDLLQRMRANIEENTYPTRVRGNHGLLEEWKRCCHGIARYLLLPGT